MCSRPLIAIATGCAQSNERSFLSQLSYSYVNSVAKAGGAPVLLPAVEDVETLDAWLDVVGGVVIPGGPDLDPALFGERPHPMVEPVTGPRAGFDIRLCQAALHRNIPILGICHGCQVLNVALGGSLYQDILTAFPDSPLVHRRRVYPYYVPHPVGVSPESALCRIVGGDRIVTNSSHHQSVKGLGRGLRAVAWADDGIVEAVEWEGEDRFALGVQWHPEKMAEREDGPHRALAEAAAHRRNGAIEGAGRR